MTDPTRRDEPRAAENHDLFSQLEDHLEQLAGREAWTRFRENHFDTPEYRELVAALMA